MARNKTRQPLTARNRMEKFKVTFYPDNKSIEVSKDTTILSAALSCDVYINSSCGGDGVCGRCKVVVKKGKVLTQPTGILSADERSRNIYLACLTTVHGDVEVEVPEQAKLELDVNMKGLYAKSEEVNFSAPQTSGQEFPDAPLTKKIFLELPQPTLNDNVSDAERLFRQIRKLQDTPVMQTGLANIRQLGELLRDSDWKVTVTLGKKDDSVEIVLVEPDDTSKNNFGLAFDIGTTTISGQLVDLNSKKTLGTKATFNRQASFGADVITRIVYAQKEDGLQKLHNAVVETINGMITDLISEHKVHLSDITSIVFAGNTTMIHLLLMLDPTFIRRDPYVPTANFLPIMRAQEANININPRGLMACVPGVASYVGGDVTAGVLSSGLFKEKELSLLIDIGTNGEIVLGNEEFMVACAASAGPAFEGSGVTCGMRATNGAIQKITVNPKGYEVSYDTIGNTQARGICGSGYIDLLYQLLKAGIIDKGGKIIAQDASRIRQGDLGREFVIEKDIVINEADIDNLKRAKAAIFSATSILVKHVGLEMEEIKKIFIAGGFGTSLDIDSAIRIGLLPDLERPRFIFIGNSSLAGARQVLLSSAALKKTEEIARKITYFELSMDPAYMDEYMAALFFPHTDLEKFPSVRY